MAGFSVLDLLFQSENDGSAAGRTSPTDSFDDSDTEYHTETRLNLAKFHITADRQIPSVVPSPRGIETARFIDVRCCRALFPFTMVKPHDNSQLYFKILLDEIDANPESHYTVDFAGLACQRPLCDYLCLCSRGHFFSQTGKPRHVHAVLFWKHMLGHTFPISNTMIRDPVVRSFASCELGFSGGAMLCVSPQHIEPTNYVLLLQVLLQQLHRMGYFNRPSDALLHRFSRIYTINKTGIGQDVARHQFEALCRVIKAQ